MNKIYTVTVNYYSGGQTCFVSIFAKNKHQAKTVAEQRVFEHNLKDYKDIKSIEVK